MLIHGDILSAGSDSEETPAPTVTPVPDGTPTPSPVPTETPTPSVTPEPISHTRHHQSYRLPSVQHRTILQSHRPPSITPTPTINPEKEIMLRFIDGEGKECEHLRTVMTWGESLILPNVPDDKCSGYVETGEK